AARAMRACSRPPSPPWTVSRDRAAHEAGAGGAGAGARGAACRDGRAVAALLPRARGAQDRRRTARAAAALDDGSTRRERSEARPLPPRPAAGGPGGRRAHLGVGVAGRARAPDAQPRVRGTHRQAPGRLRTPHHPALAAGRGGAAMTGVAQAPARQRVIEEEEMIEIEREPRERAETGRVIAHVRAEIPPEHQAQTLRDLARTADGEPQLDATML